MSSEVLVLSFDLLSKNTKVIFGVVSSSKQQHLSKTVIQFIIYLLCKKKLQQQIIPNMGNYAFPNNNQKSSLVETKSNIPEIVFGVKDIIKVTQRALTSKYRLCYPSLGSGSYGEVFKAINLQTRAVKAVKKIQTSLLGNQFNILTQLDHPNVLKIYEMYNQGQFCYIVTDFYEGGSLADLLGKFSRLSEKKVLNYMFQILSGVNYLHSKNIIHGDLKPENILLDETKQKIYLADFGLAAYQSETECKPTGTKQFMAPDGIRVFCQKKFDMWACGVIMYMLLTGNIPPQVQKLPCYLQKYKWLDFSNDAKDLLMKLLDVDPERRITARGAVFHNWFLKIHEDLYSSSVEWLRKMIQNMLKNSHKNSIQRLILFYIANFVIDKQKRRCSEYFIAFDHNLDGVITKQQFSIIFHKLNIQDDLDKLFEIIDSNNSGKIDYAQFLTFGAASQKLCSQQFLVKAFLWLDQDNDRKISREQLQQSLNGQMPAEAIEQMMNECDSDRNGYIQYDEFLRFVRS